MTRWELGFLGEQYAADYLEREGYTILGCNLMVGHSDIDILAEKGNVLIFCEVRTKSRADRGMPEETLSGRKLRQMRQTAEIYLALHGPPRPARLDAICLIMEEGGTVPHFKHYEGVG